MASRITLKDSTGNDVFDMEISDLSALIVDEGGPNQLIINPGWFYALQTWNQQQENRIDLNETNIIDLQNRVTALESK